MYLSVTGNSSLRSVKEIRVATSENRHDEQGIFYIFHIEKDGIDDSLITLAKDKDYSMCNYLRSQVLHKVGNGEYTKNKRKYH